QSPEAVRFGRRYGFILVRNLISRFGWTPELGKVLKDVDVRAQADPAASKSLLEELRTAKSADEVNTLLGKEKPPKPKRKPVRATKKSLPVDRESDAWETNREEAKRFADDHKESLTDEQLDLRADVLTFVEEVKVGKYKRFGRASKLKFLDAFDAVAKASGMQ